MTPRPKAEEQSTAPGKAAAVRPLLLRDREVAAALARSVGWVRLKRYEDARAMREGRDPEGPKWITIRKNVFYRPADLEEWIAANAVERGIVVFSNRGGGR
jgi:hypothetical protein